MLFRCSLSTMVATSTCSRQISFTRLVIIPWCHGKKFRLSCLQTIFAYALHNDWCYHSIHKHPVVLRGLRLMVCLVQVLMSYLVCHRVVFLVHCCFCCTLLTFLGCFRMSWLVMRTTLPCFVGYHILVIGHPWQHR